MRDEAAIRLRAPAITDIHRVTTPSPNSPRLTVSFAVPTSARTFTLQAFTITGMKIYDKGNFQTPVRFAGVLQAKGDKLNEVLRAMEPPSHNDWQPERYDDPAYARSLRKQLYGWMNDRIRELSGFDDKEELD